ncbi:hypothetical protein HKX48_000625 [Thoreauomyces humboldtii]|nr:hypothetical protein HKX48_000625 [Thoreauomyces humboldtii]
MPCAEYSNLPKLTDSSVRKVTDMQQFLKRHDKWLTISKNTSTERVIQHLRIYMAGEPATWFKNQEEESKFDGFSRSMILEAIRLRYWGLTQKNRARLRLAKLEFNGTVPEDYHAKFNKLANEARLAGSDDLIPDSDMNNWQETFSELLAFEKAKNSSITISTLQDYAESLGVQMGLVAKGGKRSKDENPVNNDDDSKEKKRKVNNNNAQAGRGRGSARGGSSRGGSPASKGRGGGGKRDVSDVTCYTCQRKGHYSNDCPDKESGKKKAQMNQSNADKPPSGFQQGRST